MSQPSFESQLYSHAHQLLKTHETLLRDAVRNRAFYSALEQCVTADSHVLDIGAGVGIWAVTAAKLGAKRVVAIDMDELLVGLTRKLAVEHGVSDRVEVIWGNSFGVHLEREFDIVVSETIGYLGYDEAIVEIMADARERFLKPGGVFIPETVSLHAAAAKLNVRTEAVPVGVPIDLAELMRINLNSPRVLKRKEDATVLTEARCLVSTDLYTGTVRPNLNGLKASWETREKVDCFLVWVESRLCDGVVLDTRETSSWFPNVYRVEPSGGHWQVDLTLSLTAESNYWTVEFSGEGETVARSYSPEYAAVEMLRSAREAWSVDLRDATDADDEFLCHVYASTRAAEVSAFGWSPHQVDSFLRSQYHTQKKSYRMQMPDSVVSVVFFGGNAAGRLIVDRGDDVINLVDIAVLPEFRRAGIAGTLIRQLQGEGRPVKLLVDKSNPDAIRLYGSLGFVVIDESDFDLSMSWMGS